MASLDEVPSGLTPALRRAGCNAPAPFSDRLRGPRRLQRLVRRTLTRLQVDDSCHCAKGLIYRPRIPEHVSNIRVQDHDVGTLGIPLRILPTNATTEVVVVAHSVSVTVSLPHTSLARVFRPSAR